MGAKRKKPKKPPVVVYPCAGVPGEDECGRSTNRPNAFEWEQDSDGAWRCPRCMRTIRAEARVVAVAGTVVALKKIREPLLQLLRLIDLIVYPPRS